MNIVEHIVQCNNVSTWNLRPFGDLQFGAPGFQDDLWEKWCRETKNDPFSLTIGMGDYVDWWRPTVQTKLEIASAGDNDMRESIDSLHQSHMQKVLDKISSVINPKRCLGFLSGHHDYTYSTGINSTQWLCDKLKVPYLGRMAYIRVRFLPKIRTTRNYSGHCYEILIHAQHGDGGAGLIGTDIANLERKTFPYWRGDLFLRGHSTKRWTAPVVEYYPMFEKGRHHSARLVQKDIYLVNTGGFMSGYPQGETSYVERKNIPPANLGYCVVHLTLERHNPNVNLPPNGVRITVTQ